MIKSELIQRLADANPHLLQRDVETIVNVIFSEISDALARGDRVELRGFGAFTVKHRAARQGRNPRTGEPVEVEEKYVPFFKTGKELRERLNKDYAPAAKATGRTRSKAGASSAAAPAKRATAKPASGTKTGLAAKSTRTATPAKATPSKAAAKSTTAKSATAKGAAAKPRAGKADVETVTASTAKAPATGSRRRGGSSSAAKGA